jgi:hypothetical protein
MCLLFQLLCLLGHSQLMLEELHVSDNRWYPGGLQTQGMVSMAKIRPS